MRSDRVPVKLVSYSPQLSVSPFDDPVIDLVDWRIDTMREGGLSDAAAPMMVVMQIASFALDRIVELAGRITLRGGGGNRQISLPVGCMLTLAPGQVRSIILEITDRATKKSLQDIARKKGEADLKIAHVVYEDGSIEEFAH